MLNGRTTTSHRLIQYKNIFSDPKLREEHGRNHTGSQGGFSLKKLGFAVFLLLVIPTAFASAGFFSDIIGMFTKVTTEARPINSQNIALLSAAVGTSVVSAEESDVNTVADSALLPDVGPTGGPTDIESDFDHGQISIYTVHEGDSLASIAKMFDVSVNTILWANNMQKGAKLTVGQALLILPVSGVQYEVKKGDTIAGIAKKFKGDPDEIRSYNSLGEDTVLEPGMTIIIPDGEIVTATPAKTKPATSKLRGVSVVNDDAYFIAPLANYRRSQKLHGYNGVDMTSYLGAPIVAAAGGKVIVARQGGYNGGYGNYVVIKHSNGTQTLYAHMTSVGVNEGVTVVQGQVIGTLGNTGRSTGPHLHFEVRGARNPFAY
jgi:LysM repeat protein